MCLLVCEFSIFVHSLLGRAVWRVLNVRAAFSPVYPSDCFIIDFRKRVSSSCEGLQTPQLSRGSRPLIFTAHVQRGPSEAARCASTGGFRALPLPAALAERAHFYNAPSKLARFSSWKGTHVGLSAPVGRGPSEGARSGSTGPTWVSFFSPRHSPNGHLLILLVSLRRSGQVALDCAHRTSTFLSCAFCEQKGHLAAPPFPIAESRRAATFLLGFA